jgi:hypothetical protein
MPASQALCSSLLEECFDILQQIKAQEESKNVASSLKPIHDRLNELRAELENLVLTHRWSLRETDLYNYSMSLHEIDKMRIDGKFVDAEGNRPPGQYVSARMLAHRQLFTHITGSAILAETVLWSYLPVVILKRTSLRRTHPRRASSSHLSAISVHLPHMQANKLSTVKKCLNEVYKYGGPFTPRDLYPVSFPVWSIGILEFNFHSINLHCTRSTPCGGTADSWA